MKKKSIWRPARRQKPRADEHEIWTILTLFILYYSMTTVTRAGLDRGSRSNQVQQANEKRNGWCARVPPDMFRGTAVCGGKQ